ncbi:flagellar hook-length control protein FliK [Roseomonas elaeocarpi]|uniref:Flagellar hook-length control protein FliK n=1 Tax=Roseomonas elaeocarpi TaxID=907779 RepID=A0ABV6JTW6_9PROT
MPDPIAAAATARTPPAATPAAAAGSTPGSTGGRATSFANLLATAQRQGDVAGGAEAPAPTALARSGTAAEPAPGPDAGSVALAPEIAGQEEFQPPAATVPPDAAALTPDAAAGTAPALPAAKGGPATVGDGEEDGSEQAAAVDQASSPTAEGPVGPATDMPAPVPLVAVPAGAPAAARTGTAAGVAGEAPSTAAPAAARQALSGRGAAAVAAGGRDGKAEGAATAGTGAAPGKAAGSVVEGAEAVMAPVTAAQAAAGDGAAEDGEAAPEASAAQAPGEPFASPARSGDQAVAAATPELRATVPASHAAAEAPAAAALPASATSTGMAPATLPFAVPAATPGFAAAAPLEAQAAPVRTAPPPSAAAQVSGVAIGLSFGASGGSGVEVVLEPAELGRVHITIHREGEQASLHLAAERPETLALLQRDSGELNRALSAAGVVPEGGLSMDFSLSGGGGGAAGEGGGTGRQSPPWRGASDRGATPAAANTDAPLRSLRSLLDIAI